MNNTTVVFGWINKDLTTLNGWASLDEHKMKGYNAMFASFEDDYSKVLFCVHELEQGRKAQLNMIKALQMDLAFHKSNTGVDVQRIQRLEEQFDDLSNAVAMMQGKLCTCGGKVRVFLL